LTQRRRAVRGMRLGPAGWDIVAGVALVGLAAIVWWQTALLPPPIFDPIGSALIPQLVALVIAGLSLVMIAARLGTAREEWRRGPLAAGETRGGWPPARRALAIVAMLLAYGALLQIDGVGFTPATVLFVAATGLLLSRGNRHVMVGSVISAFLLAAACSYVFTQIFYIDLP
jgi:putative tricarboxylic transport membrane protein